MCLAPGKLGTSAAWFHPNHRAIWNSRVSNLGTEPRDRFREFVAHSSLSSEVTLIALRNKPICYPCFHRWAVSTYALILLLSVTNVTFLLDINLPSKDVAPPVRQAASALCALVSPDMRPAHRKYTSRYPAHQFRACQSGPSAH
jgi:hypothetical protein